MSSRGRDAANELAGHIDSLTGSIPSLMQALDWLIEGERRQDPLFPLLRDRLGELLITADELVAGAESLAWEGKGEDGDVGGEDGVEIEVEEVES
jgi:hypothetical protein